ncbi:MAG: hypothetical protein IT546_07335 [Caulobacteraceae bacterium]|nr:hypothetical protein [Caulobacteraceae bacterium]
MIRDSDLLEGQVPEPLPANSPTFTNRHDRSVEALHDLDAKIRSAALRLGAHPEDHHWSPLVGVDVRPDGSRSPH